MADDDGNVQLPAAVRARIAEGQRLFKAQHEAPPPPQTQEVSPPPGTPQVVQEPQPTNPSPVYNPTPEVPPPQANAEERHQPREEENSLAALQRQLQRSEQANRTLQGRMREQLSQRDKQIADLQAAINNATQQMAELTARVLANGNTNGGAVNNGLTNRQRFDKVTDAERKDYGDDFLDMVGRVAQEIVDQRMATVVGPIQTKYDALGNEIQQTQKTLKVSKDDRRNRWLDSNVPGWRQIDIDPGFADWLEDEDVNSGFPRKVILAKAVDDENFNRIKSIFEGYATELGVIAPPPPPRTQQGRARLEAQAMPNGGNGRVDAIVPDAPEAPPTPEEITAYFHRKIHHPRSLTEAEITRFEGRLRNGLATGTIRGQPRV